MMQPEAARLHQIKRLTGLLEAKLPKGLVISIKISTPST